MAEKKYEYHHVGSHVEFIDEPSYGAETVEKGQVWRQYIIAAIVNIGVVCTGISLGWSSPVHVLLSNVTTSPLDHAITVGQEAWMGSLLATGAIFGPFIAGFAVSVIGVKWGLLCCSIPLMIGWILILAAAHAGMIYAGRIFSGLGVGMVFTVSPMYCAEIATDDSRGALGSYVQLFSSIGFLIVYSIGPFVSYNVIAFVGLAHVLLFTVGVLFMPESPMFYLIKNNREGATESLSKIRGRSIKAVQNEIEKMNDEIQISKSRTAMFTDIFRGNNFKALYISSALFFFHQFSGIDAVLFYLSIIFEAAGAKIDSAICVIIVGVVLVAASVIPALVVDRLGRRILLLVSTSGTALAQGLLGMYFLLAEYKMPIVEHLSYLPVLALGLFIVAFSVGIGPLPFAIMSELLPIEVKTVASPIATTLCWILLFLITRFFSSVAEAVGMGVTFLIFSSFCVCGFFFSFFVVPETKGKSFQEIQDILSGNSSGSLQKEGSRRSDIDRYS